MVTTVEIMGIVIALLAFAYAAWLYSWVKKQPQENATITRIGGLMSQVHYFLHLQVKSVSR